MDSRITLSPQSEEFAGAPTAPCTACEAALQSPDQQHLSFLLLDQHTIPVVGCDEHQEEFTTICGYTTDESADLVEHQPAGGIGCPSCHLAPYNLQQPVVPVGTGAVSILACPEHQSEIISRYQAGLETRQQLTTSLDTGNSQPN